MLSVIAKSKGVHGSALEGTCAWSGAFIYNYLLRTGLFRHEIFQAEFQIFVEISIDLIKHILLSNLMPVGVKISLMTEGKTGKCRNFVVLV